MDNSLKPCKVLGLWKAYGPRQHRGSHLECLLQPGWKQKWYKLVSLFTCLQLEKAAVGALGSGLTCDPGAQLGMSRVFVTVSPSWTARYRSQNGQDCQSIDTVTASPAHFQPWSHITLAKPQKAALAEHICNHSQY